MGRSTSSSASLGLTEYSQVDMLGLRYISVNFGAEKSRAHQTGQTKQGFARTVKARGGGQQTSSVSVGDSPVVPHGRMPAVLRDTPLLRCNSLDTPRSSLLLPEYHDILRGEESNPAERDRASH